MSALDAFLDELADRIAARLTKTTSAPERIPLADVAQHGAPSPRWLRDQARHKRIEIKGPRGARYVDADALAGLLGATTIKRKSAPEESGEHPVASDVVAQLAARRAK